jgi:hypothetical protein
MSSVKKLTSRVQAGRKLDVDAAKALIKAAVADGKVDAASELAPIKDLFRSSSVESTRTGKQLLEAFVSEAQRPGAKAKELASAAVSKVVDTTSEAALMPLYDKYKGTKSDGTTRYTHAHEANEDIEARRLAVMLSLQNYLSRGNLHRDLVAIFSPRKAGRLENDPLSGLREYLASHYPPK